MASLEIDERTASELLAAAAAEGVSVGRLVRSLLENSEKRVEASVSVRNDRKQAITPRQFLAEVEELSFDGPTLPADFSRADIYRGDD